LLNGLKTLGRNMLPKRYQVPAKYWYNRLRGMLEEEMNLLPFLFHANDRVIDIGANRGIYAYQFWRLGAEVEVFEPNPVCAVILSTWAADKATVHVHPVALSSRAGSASLHIPIDDSGTEHDASASIEHAGFAHSREQPVSLQTLDNFRYESVSLIKIDVEGHETSVLEGATATLASSRPALLVEIEQRHNAAPIDGIFARLLEFGYRGYFLSKGKLAELEEFDVARDQAPEHFGKAGAPYINNFLFLHSIRLAGGEYVSLVRSRLLD
jgi:FkbM family methyltransferase